MATKFHMFTNVLVFTHVYYSSCWVHYMIIYQRMKTILDMLFDINGSKASIKSIGTYVVLEIGEGLVLLKFKLKYNHCGIK
jgi:hypothetical protein